MHLRLPLTLLSFPPVFSPKDDELIWKARPPTGIYNPFVSSPDKLLASAVIDSRMEPSELHQPVLLDERLLEDDVDSSPIKIRDTFPSASSPPRLARLSQPSTPEEKKADPSDTGYSTPPHGSQAVPESQNSGQPRRPEKMVPESARARYEKALQPCTNGTKSGKDGHGKSPSLSVNTIQMEPFESNLVKRAQQRRVKQYMHPMSDPEVRQSHGSDCNEVSREHPFRSDNARSINEQPFDEIEDGPLFSLSSQSESGINHSSFNTTFKSTR
jgi:hypothetical protein